MNDHHPPHILLDDTWYIISSATNGHVRLLTTHSAKLALRDTLRSLVQHFDFGLQAWVILDNHYHLLLRTRYGKDLPTLIARLHGSTSRQIRLENPAIGRRMWLNYWDTCIRSEEDLWTRFNYIHQNPVKHGYTRKLEDWSYSSYHNYQRTKGEDWLRDCWEKYPPIDFLEGDKFSSEGSIDV